MKFSTPEFDPKSSSWNERMAYPRRHSHDGLVAAVGIHAC